MLQLKDDYAEVFEYLNALRDSGATNMFGAGAYLERDLGLERHEARQYLTDWMKWFPGDKEVTDPEVAKRIYKEA